MYSADVMGFCLLMCVLDVKPLLTHSLLFSDMPWRCSLQLDAVCGYASTCAHIPLLHMLPGEGRLSRGSSVGGKGVFVLCSAAPA